MRIRNLCFAFTLAITGCQSPSDQREAPKQVDAGAASKVESTPVRGADDSASKSVNPLGMMSLLSRGSEARSDPFDDPPESSPAPNGAYTAVVDLNGTLSEVGEPFSAAMFLDEDHAESVTLRSVIWGLRRLEQDDQVKGLLLRFHGLRANLAMAEELRTLLASLQKPLACHFETADNLTLFVASACRRVVIAPLGEVVFTGPLLAPVYLKKLLDSLHVEGDFIHIGSFKGAAEPITRTGPSPEMQKTYDDLLDGAYSSLVAGVAKGRKVAEPQVRSWIDQGLFTAEEARAAGLLDEVATFETTRGALAPWKSVRLTPKKKLDFASLFGGSGNRSRPSGPRVALLYAVGEVVDGRGSRATAFERITSGRLAAAIRAAAAEDDIKALVLRVDSPGGSALASELIWNAVAEAQKRKAVIVSMGGVAASGGYYIASGAQRIFAQPNTITGSIGVIGGKLVLGPALDRLGVHVIPLGKGKHATTMTTIARWSQDERRLIEATMRQVYTTFKQRVAAGRHTTPEKIEANAQGRVFTGAQALERGLVDELGGLDEALDFARKTVGLPSQAPTEIYPSEPSLSDLLSRFTGDAEVTGASARLESLLASAALTAAPLLGTDATTLRSALSLVSAFCNERVQLVSFLPAIR